jgi:hypothetical protein
MRAEHDARDQEDRDIGHSYLPRHERRQRTDREDQPGGEQRVLRDCRGGQRPVTFPRLASECQIPNINSHENCDR